jgi:hypothetical protein
MHRQDFSLSACPPDDMSHDPTDRPSHPASPSAPRFARQMMIRHGARDVSSILQMLAARTPERRRHGSRCQVAHRRHLLDNFFAVCAVRPCHPCGRFPLHFAHASGHLVGGLGRASSKAHKGSASASATERTMGR